MALRFDPGAYESVFQRGREVEEANRRRPFEALAQLAQTSQGIADQASKDRLYRVEQARLAEENKTLAEKYPQLFSRNSLSDSVANGSAMPLPSEASAGVSDTDMGIGNAPPPSGGGIVEQFENFRKGISSPSPIASPTSTIDDLISSGKYRLKDLPALSEARERLFKSTPKAVSDNIDSIDKYALNEIKSGRMTLEDYYKLKNQYTPAMGNLDFKKEEALRKEAEDRSKKEQAVSTQNQEARMVMDKIDTALKKVTPLSSGAGAYTADVPIVGQAFGSTNLKADIDSIKANLGFSKLMEMKQNSKAGASGLGALSDNEMALLTSVVASLDPKQKDDQLREKMLQIKKHYENILKMNEGVNPFQNGQPGQPQGNQPIIQVNKKTGQRRQSLDGGRTWQMLP